MKTISIVFWLFLNCCVVNADLRATVVIHPAAFVSGDYFVLSDIATVTSPDTAFRSQVMSAVMGRCPLPGLTRPFHEGDVALKLRQAGIDPQTIAISGAADLVVTGGGSISVTPGTPAQAAIATVTTLTRTASTAPKTILIHYGDTVTLEYDCDGLDISAKVVAMSSGAAGDTISLRRDGAIHPLTGTVVDAQTVRMVE